MPMDGSVEKPGPPEEATRELQGRNECSFHIPQMSSAQTLPLCPIRNLPDSTTTKCKAMFCSQSFVFWPLWVRGITLWARKKAPEQIRGH